MTAPLCTAQPPTRRLLAAPLAAYPLEELCRRLDCSEATARLLYRAAPPRPNGWLGSVRGLARALGVEPAALSLLLAEALRDGAPDADAARAAGVGG